MDSLPIKHPASYRDPAGFIFHHEGKLYRQVNQCFREDFDLFISSGLYKELSTSGMLVEHQVLGTNFTADEEWYKTITPEVVKFISYPYEWCFQMLKDAALLTLTLTRKAIDHGLILKDASPYNIQLHNGKLIFIDSLSFARYEETKPWIAYRQFCENFLAPLAIMHYSGMPLHSLSLAYPDGIPLAIAQKLLPFQSKFSLHQYLHLHLHNKLSKKSAEGNKSKSFSLHKLKNILRSLETAVSHLQLNYKGIWSEYYPEAAQRQNYLPEKKEIIARWIEKIEASTVFDAGANDGTFSRLTNARGWFTLSADIDHSAVTKLYGEVIKESLSIHPLIIDLANPSPANGVNYEERKSLSDRFHADLILALALIHHLAIGKNIPFEMIAKMFRQLGEKLIIEFIPKDDEKIQLMLQQKQDIYHWYTQFNFKQAFSKYYTILEVKELFRGRTLFLMQPL